MELSPGADLTSSPSIWSWTDLTLLGGYVHDPSGISITRGRQDRNAQTSPSTCALTLKNPGGIWVPDNPLGPYYGLLDINTPLRVLMRPNTNSAADAFGRTASSSWGSADVGGAWTNTGGSASDFSVGSGAGRHTNTGALTPHYSQLALSIIRFDVKVRVRVNATSTGGGQTAGVVCRFVDTSNHKRAVLNFGTDSSITLQLVSRVSGTDTVLTSTATGLTHSTSSFYWIRLQTGLTSVRAKAWADGTSEPATWLIDGASLVLFSNPVAGTFGCWSRRETSNTTVSATTDFDDFSMVDGPLARFTGYVDSWPTSWTDASERQSLAKITASGHLRRLAVGKTLKSATFRALSTSPGLVAYWPMEDGSGATVFSSAVGGSPVVWSGAVSPAADSAVKGSEPLPNVGATGRIQFPVPAYPASTSWSVQFVIRAPSIPASTAQVMSWSTPGGSIARWQLTVAAGSPDTMRLEGFNAAGSATFVDSSISMADSTSSAELFNDRQMLIQATGNQNGSNIDLSWSAWYAPDDGSFTASAVGRAPSVAGTIANVTLLSHDSNSGWTVEHTIGHVAVSSVVVGTDAIPSAITGNAGETAQARLTRLGNQEKVATLFGEILGNLSGTTIQKMGPQPSATFLDQLREIEATEGGVLFDGIQGQVTILPRSLRRSHAVNLTLDHNAKHLKEGHESVWDDQLIRNDIQVNNASGAIATALDKTGQATRGVYGDPVRINANSDTDATQHAAWRLHLGRTPERRYPALTFELHNPRCASLTDTWLGCDIGYRVNVTNLPNMYGNVADLLIEGYTETFNQSLWTVTLNCSPAGPWDTYTVEATGNRGRVDTGGSRLLAGYDSSATSLLVATTVADGAQWSTTATPYDWLIAGERMTVTTMNTNTGSFVAAGTASHANNASLTPSLPAGVQKGDLLLVFAAIRNTSATITTPAGYSVLLAAGHVALFGKIHTGSESAPTVAFSGGSTGDSTSAQMAAFRYVQCRAALTASSSNGSAQNIAVPAALPPQHRAVALWLGWKQASWTSVLTFSGTEIGEPSTALGSGQGLVWDYSIQSLATEVASGNFIVSGGSSAISKGFVVWLPADVQSCTITRAVNGVSKSQTAGAALALYKPGAITL